MKKEYAEDNYPEKVANRNQKRLTAAAHTTPLVSKTSEPEGIPETLLIGISKCAASECDARTGNMFGY
ncbi:MAG: hypothetical protein WCC78_12415, partial [Terriglobales bacterium]